MELILLIKALLELAFSIVVERNSVNAFNVNKLNDSNNIIIEQKKKSSNKWYIVGGCFYGAFFIDFVIAMVYHFKFQNKDEDSHVDDNDPLLKDETNAYTDLNNQK